MSGRGIRDRLVLAALLALVLSAMALGAAPAQGYFSATGSGTPNASVASLTVPNISAATAAAGGTVTLTWAKSTAPGPVAYYVTRDGGAPGGTCPSQAAPANDVGTCVDSGLEPGTYTYKVVATYRTWTSTGATNSAKVTIGPADHFVLAVASTTPTAGAADNLTITAKDKAGSTVTSYKESHSLTFEGATAIGTNKPTVANSSGTATAFGTATALTFTAGVAIVSSTKNGVMKLYKVEAATISATDGTIKSEGDPTVTVAPSTFAKLILAAASTAPVAGAEDALTVTASDTYGNTVPTYTGSHSLVYSGPVASVNGNVPTVSDISGNDVAFGTATPTNFTSGVATVSGENNGQMVLYKAAAASVKVTEGSISSATVTVTATGATGASLKLAAATVTPLAGATDSLTLTAIDAYGNTATPYAGAKNITFSGPEASPSGTAASVTNSSGTAINVGTATPLTFTAGVAAVSSGKNGSFKPARAGATTLSATDGTISTPSALALTVGAGAAARYAWSAPTISAGTLGSPCLFACTVTALGNSGTFTAKVAVTDALGNVVSNLGTANAVTVTATAGSTVTGGSLTIATTGLAESTATFTYTSPASGTFTNTITAAKSSGTAYTSATATVTK